MLTREQMIAELEADDVKQAAPALSREQMIAELEADDAQSQSMEGEVSAEEFAAVDEDSNDNWNTTEMQKGGAREFASGALFGGADELEAGVRAIPSLFKSGQGFRDTYDQKHADINAEREAFKEAHPRDAGVSEAGGLIGSMGFGFSGAKAVGAKLLPSTLKASKLGQSRLAQNMLLGGGIAGTAGALHADQGERAKGLAGGAGLGAGLTGILGVAGKLGGKTLDLASTRFVEKNMLDDAGNFTPISMAEGTNPFVKSAYEMLGKTFGTKYRGQIAAKLEREGERAAGLEKSALAQKEAQVAKHEAAVAQLDEEVYGIKAGISADKRAKDSRLQSLTRSKEAQLTAKEEAGIKAEELKSEAVTRAADRRIRSEAIESSLPVKMEAAEVEAILDLPEEQAMEAVNKFWRSRAFSVAKDKESFSVNPAAIKAKIKEMLKKEGGEKYTDEIMNQIDTVITNKMKNGVMSGADMVEARSSLGRMAGQVGNSGEGMVHKHALNLGKDTVDDFITAQLSAKEASMFRSDISRWRSQVAYKDAAGRAIEKGGKFSTSDYMKAIKAKQKSLALEGRGTLQSEAVQLGQAKEMAVEKAAASKAAIKTETSRLKDVRTNRLNKAKELQSVKTDRLKFEAGVDKKAKKSALDKALKAKDALVHSPEAVEAKAIREIINAEKSKLTPNIFTNIAASKVVSLGVTSLAGLALGSPAVSSIALGAGLSHAASSQKFQRFLAGQVKSTEAFAKLKAAIAKDFPPDKRDEAMKAVYMALRSEQASKIIGD